eukprot:NODE_358_length_2378_cov_27.773293_g333_i0.p1 GENE.NODE_358_length_2378_cov_27.773293_g333_i0~~NODE_358_length_2378_cov_27.773293_g333_i0.p1  ORF type:complete len:383 (+),score=41.80 NODE_358_length_2378_cov_27.773293_g333_i0:193-1341(+)
MSERWCACSRSPLRLVSSDLVTNDVHMRWLSLVVSFLIFWHILGTFFLVCWGRARHEGEFDITCSPWWVVFLAVFYWLLVLANHVWSSRMFVAFSSLLGIASCYEAYILSISFIPAARALASMLAGEPSERTLEGQLTVHSSPFSLVPASNRSYAENPALFIFNPVLIVLFGLIFMHSLYLLFSPCLPKNWSWFWKKRAAYIKHIAFLLTSVHQLNLDFNGVDSTEQYSEEMQPLLSPVRVRAHTISSSPRTRNQPRSPVLTKIFKFWRTNQSPRISFLKRLEKSQRACFFFPPRFLLGWLFSFVLIAVVNGLTLAVGLLVHWKRLNLTFSTRMEAGLEALRFQELLAGFASYSLPDGSRCSFGERSCYGDSASAAPLRLSP